MFSATAFTVGPTVLFYLLGRRGDVAALRVAIAFDAALERTAGAVYGLGILLGLLAAATGGLDLTAPCLLTAYGLVVVVIDDREDLRRSKLSTTMDLYVHAYDDEDLRGAVGALDRALGS